MKMEDFIGSVAQQDVTISTEVVKTAVVGGNFYQNLLYVTDRFSDFGSDTPVYPVVTKATYEDVIASYAYLADVEKAIIKRNLASLYAYSDDVTVYIIPSSLVSKYKFKAYFTFLDLEWRTADGTASDYSLEASARTTLSNLTDFDKAFTRPLCELPVDPSKVKGTDTATTQGTLTLLTETGIDLSVFARAAMPSGAAGTANAFVDATNSPFNYSPALYQLGYSLATANESGVPVGNDFDMRALSFTNVIPTNEDSVSDIEGSYALFASWFEKSYVNYFKPVGNGTGNVTNFGGWTIKANCIGAEWIVAYLNYMNRVSCATIITSGMALKNQKTYGSLLDAVKINIGGQVRNGRIEQFKLTAPSFSELPKSNGHTIVIPNAWTGVYADNVRKVKISGTLTVAA